MKQTIKFSFALALLALIAAPTASFAAGDAAKGKEIFSQRCATCHGMEGKGDGPAGIALPPEMKPRNLQSEPLKIAGDDAKFKELIHKGGAAMGLQPLMPAQADLTDADLDNLMAFVRSLRK